MKLAGTALRLAAVAALGSALCVSGASAGAVAQAPPPLNPVGHLLYVDGGGSLEVTTVQASGATTPPEVVGPLSLPTGSQKASVYSLIASGDGAWAAWSETAASPPPSTDATGLLVARNNNNGLTYRLKSFAQPIGFVGHTLVAGNGTRVSKLVLTPAPHLVPLHDRSRVIATYKHGLVDDVVTFPKNTNSSRFYEHVRLHSLGGHKRSLHTYTDGGKKLRGVSISTTSGDSRRLVIERGDHTDFGGVGPSSAVDELSLTGAAHFEHLGHYGAAAARWRVWTESFVGRGDHVWVTWYRASAGGVHSVVARWRHGHWQLIAKRAVAAVGNPRGYVVVQPGKFVPVPHSIAGESTPSPTASAVLVHRGHSHALGIEGSAFVWISADDVPRSS